LSVRILLGLEGIVSKRKGSPYRYGRSPDWAKMNNSDAPAVKREADFRPDGLRAGASVLGSSHAEGARVGTDPDDQKCPVLSRQSAVQRRYIPLEKSQAYRPY
jgi:hypothetical protein